MKATEVLNRYANGERDFRRANLRGQSFKGQDLSGADFTEADIRGANFINATLTGVNFTGAEAGVQKHWVIGQRLLLLALFALAGILQGYFEYYLAAYLPRWWDSTYDWSFFTTDLAVTITFFATIAIAFIAISYQGFTTKTIVTIGFAFAVAVVGAIAGAFTDAGGVFVTGAFAGAVGIAFISAFAFAATITGNVTGGGISAILFAVIGAFTGASTGKGNVVFAIAFASAVTLVVAVTSFLLGTFAARRSLKGDENFVLVRSIGVSFVAVGGTTFRGADLTKANFTKAMLKSTNFTNIWKTDDKGKRQESETIVEWVCWSNAKHLDRARVGKSILSNPAVRDLLVTRNGYKKSYIDANLRASNLNGVNLEEAILRWADLRLRHSAAGELENADLTEALVVGTDLTGAHLTGACLEDWNISSYTNLEDVDCQYVYLLRDQQRTPPQ